MAHIDAGKTTTTERMLYYSGYTRTLGDVDDGDTVTDFMAQERERGITIQSAAVTFDWKGYRINLIDTPGHVDFTLEVERSLRVLDGAVAVFDASAGVEAQSLTVWRQADKHHIPRICFLNKMDKNGASFTLAVESIKQKLKAKPLLLQLPIGEAKTFRGIVDVVTQDQIVWRSAADLDDGKTFELKSLKEVNDPDLLRNATDARNALIEQVADLDDEFAELVLGDFSESFDSLPSEETILCGMGELHIEIIHDRIKREYGLETYLGPLQIAYRETIQNSVRAIDALDRTIGEKRHQVTIELGVRPWMGEMSATAPVIEYAENIYDSLQSELREAIETGINNSYLQAAAPCSLAAVLVAGCGAQKSLDKVSCAISKQDIDISKAQALKKADKQVLEPLMNMEVTVGEDHLGAVLADLAQRRGSIQEIQSRQDNKVVIASVPLAEMMGYSTHLRSLTSGTATFTLELASYQAMSLPEQTALLNKRSGLV
ncbi:hypothetical protein JD844_008679 [Phrynosoma platyrhinos]|uniref:Tr-type G domain-containing protein n=1 Tax=Phrynosoma platyrhinos TaxID=52577 RepID=A0ABQ7TEG3_PHRPL|nr:hypothetical protein JD844_008679 [Phrynosoma platyrhinos]